MNDLLSPFTKEKGPALQKIGAIKFGVKMIKPEELRKVTVMVISGNYAMVRRPRCMPYVVSVKDLFES